MTPIRWPTASCPHRPLPGPDAKQQYINGHFCYADKFAILTNGLGIVRHIAFLDDDFKAAHPEMSVEKKSDSPDEDKSIGDSSSLKPVLSDFFSLHPQFHPDIFLGDSAFDSTGTYGFLRGEFHFSKVLIPYNPRNESTPEKVGYNTYGYPTCPKDSSLDMKYAGHCHEKGRTTYPYENMDFRMFPGIQRDSDEWASLYKIRTIVEHAIDHLKINMCVTRRKSRNHTTTKADVFLAGIACQLTVIVAYRMNCPQYIRSLMPLIV